MSKEGYLKKDEFESLSFSLYVFEGVSQK